jgi:filamentous hemagglutinin
VELVGAIFRRLFLGHWLAIGETKIAHYLHHRTDEIVVRWGDGVGTHGADIVRIDQKTGQVTLWDTKWRTNPTLIGPSNTFTGTRLQNALQQAKDAIELSPTIPAPLRQRAIESIDQVTYRTKTPGMGPGARSSGI